MGNGDLSLTRQGGGDAICSGHQWQPRNRAVDFARRWELGEVLRGHGAGGDGDESAPLVEKGEANGDLLQVEKSPEAQHNRVIYIIGLSRHSRGWLVLSATRGMPRIDNPPEVASRYLELQLHAEPHAHRSSPSVRVDGLTDHYTGQTLFTENDACAPISLQFAAQQRT